MTKKEIRDYELIGAMSAHMLYSHFNVWNYGSQTFALSEALASKLLLTDVGRVKWEDFHLPFPAFVLQIPPTLATLKDQQTGYHALDSVLIVDCITEEGTRRLETFFMGRENDQSTEGGDDHTLFSGIICYGEDTTLAESIEKMQRHDSWSGVDVGGKVGNKAIRVLMRFVCSMILYISSHPDDRKKLVDPDVKKLHSRLSKAGGKKRKKLSKKLQELLAKPRPYIVGTKVTISSELQEAASAVGHGRSPSVASYVIGHHKMQPHGPKRSLRKLIWIEPFWRNLGAESKSQKTYKVK